MVLTSFVHCLLLHCGVGVYTRLFKLVVRDVNENVYFDDGNPIMADAPNHVVLEITYSEPGVKGDTANNPLKPATLETGAVVNVPLFVESGEKIKVDTRTGEYVERAK